MELCLIQFPASTFFCLFTAEEWQHMYCIYLLHSDLLVSPCLSQGERFVAIMRAYVSLSIVEVTKQNQSISQHRGLAAEDMSQCQNVSTFNFILHHLVFTTAHSAR